MNNNIIILVGNLKPETFLYLCIKYTDHDMTRGGGGVNLAAGSHQSSLLMVVMTPRESWF